MSSKLFSGAILVTSIAFVQAAPDVTPPPLPPPLPPVVSPSSPANSEAPTPEVRIFRREHETVQEFSTNGQVYMMRIMPDRGYPYYMIDQDGDGQLESRTYSPAHPHLLTPQWLLFSW